MNAPVQQTNDGVSFSEALKFWLKLGFISFWGLPDRSP